MVLHRVTAFALSHFPRGNTDPEIFPARGRRRGFMISASAAIPILTFFITYPLSRTPRVKSLVKVAAPAPAHRVVLLALGELPALQADPVILPARLHRCGG